MDRDQLRERISGGLFLSSMMGRTDGAYAAEHGLGADLVQLGAYLADSEDRSHPEESLLPESVHEMAHELRREVRIVREQLGHTPIAVNAACGDLDSAVKMAKAFEEAGGDIFELNVHGGYEKMLSRGLLRAMALPRNRQTLLEWTSRLCELDIPVMVKLWTVMPEVDYRELLEQLSRIAGLFGVHLNVRDDATRAPNLELVRELRPCAPGLLLCSGYVRTSEHVDALRAAGADAVGISQGVIDEPGIITRLSSEER